TVEAERSLLLAQDRHKRPGRATQGSIVVNRKDGWSGITFAGQREFVAAGAEDAVFDVTAEGEVGFAARLEFENHGTHGVGVCPAGAAAAGNSETCEQQASRAHNLFHTSLHDFRFCPFVPGRAPTPVPLPSTSSVLG